MAVTRDLSGNSPAKSPDFETEKGLPELLQFNKGYVYLDSVGFVNPRYMDDDPTKSAGFSIDNFGAVILEFDQIATGFACTHEQTLDPLGITGWFSVNGIQANLQNGTPAATVAAAGIPYIFPALGLRHRVRVTASTSGITLMRAYVSSLTIAGLLHETLSGTTATTFGTMALLYAGTVTPSAQANGTAVRQLADAVGRAVIKLGGVPTAFDPNRQALTATTETTIIAAVAAVRHELYTMTIANRDNVAHTVDVRDTTAGTVRETVIIPAGDTRRLEWDAGFPAAAVNTNWTVQLREAATTAVEISTSSYRVG